MDGDDAGRITAKGSQFFTIHIESDSLENEGKVSLSHNFFDWMNSRDATQIGLHQKALTSETTPIKHDQRKLITNES